jgi:ATP-dependent Clp protease adaptor protein ClpS
MADKNNSNPFLESELQLSSKPEVKEPKLYKVIIHNDNYTTMDFVVSVIRVVFHKAAADATRIMLQVHNKGFGIAGVYPYDIALTKISQVHSMAKVKEFPLHCSYEEA